MHTGNFGFVNLQPIYSPLLGLFTLILAASGMAMFLGNPQAGRHPTE
ncbi:MAG: hypothetical protein ACKN83_01885 [Vulcanococcus sp.]